jgi:hypothetical protein
MCLNLKKIKVTELLHTSENIFITFFNAGQEFERSSSSLSEREPISAKKRQLGIDAQGHFNSTREFPGANLNLICCDSGLPGPQN